MSIIASQNKISGQNIRPIRFEYANADDAVLVFQICIFIE